MAELYIDLRNRDVRLMVAEGGTVRYVHFVDLHLEAVGQLTEILTEVKAGFGGSFSRTHLLVPTEEITVSTHKTNALKIEDAEMIIRRAVAAETGDDDPLFHLTRMAAENNQQVYLAEYLPRAAMDRYIKMFRLAGLKLVTITSSLQVNRALFPSLQGEIHQVQAVFELGHAGVEAFFFSPSETIWYEFMAGRAMNGSDVTEPRENQDEDPERRERRRLYECMNNLHSLYSHFMNVNQEASVEKIWLSGSEGNLAGMTEAISEGLAVTTDLLVPEEVSNVESGHVYAALAGLLRLGSDRAAINFIPVALQQRFKVCSSKICLALGVIFALALVFGVVVSERNYRDLRAELKTQKSFLQNLKSSSASSRSQVKYLRQLKEMNNKEISFYEILKELTVRLPREVYLEGIEFKQNEDNNTISLTAITAYNSEFSNKQVLSRFVGSLEASPLFVNHGEPEVYYSTSDNRRMMSLAISCEAVARERGGQ